MIATASPPDDETRKHLNGTKFWESVKRSVTWPMIWDLSNLLIDRFLTLIIEVLKGNRKQSDLDSAWEEVVQGIPKVTR